jgi:RNA polymerase sigma factor (sigma-70 family)
MQNGIENSPQSKGVSGLNRQALEALLRRLGPSPESAAKEYETIRRKLTLFFEMRCTSSPEGLADETIDRVARKLDDGEPVDNVRAYFYGVARRVFLEWNRRETRERAAVEAQRQLSAPDVPSELNEARIDCLKSCLLSLPEESRQLILSYYDVGRRPSEETRKALAERLGLTYGNLKIKAYRIREQLAECLRVCLHAQEGKASVSAGARKKAGL